MIGLTHTVASQPINVLLVDENPQTQASMESTFYEMGLNLVAAATLEDALRQMAEGEFVVVLVDVSLPVAEGFQIAAKIKECDHSRHTPIMFITGHRRADLDVHRGYHLGAVDYIFKPVNPEVLRARVMTFVELYLRREEVKRQAEALRAEVADRQRAEAEVRRLNTELEHRVAERTEQLRAEIGDRRRAEERMRASLAEKEVLLREIHHRVKNNLQVIASLLRLQASHSTDPSALGIFQESQNRVRAMAMIHERLYRSESMAEVDFGGYVSRLASSLLRSYSVRPGAVKLESRVDAIGLSIDTAIPLGLIVNELISNSLKHAFPDGREGIVGIELHLQGEDECIVAVRDNGVGFAAGVNIENPKTLGLQVVQTLTDQLGGTLDLRSDGRETCVSVAFPLACPVRVKATPQEAAP